MDLYREAMYLLRILALTTGVGVIFVGIVQGAFVARGAGDRGRVAGRILGHASLGLEFFVGATLLTSLEPYPDASRDHGHDDRRPQAPNVLPQPASPGRLSATASVSVRPRG
ncbi:MAG: hypothetical protein M3P37_05450 [Actinomycetota bacterium]|nr:hypothetical protein [Actinomycetota bacterium]